MLLPKRVKYRKVMRGRMKGKATRGNVVSDGEYGLQAKRNSETSWLKIIISEHLSRRHVSMQELQKLLLRESRTRYM